MNKNELLNTLSLKKLPEKKDYEQFFLFFLFFYCLNDWQRNNVAPPLIQLQLLTEMLHEVYRIMQADGLCNGCTHIKNAKKEKKMYFSLNATKTGASREEVVVFLFFYWAVQDGLGHFHT